MKKHIMLLLAFFAITINAIAGDTLAIADVSLERGTATALGVNLSNTSTSIIGFQFDLTLPAGVKPATSASGTVKCTAKDRLGDSYTLRGRLQSGNTYRFVYLSTNGTAVTDTVGTLFSIRVTADTAAVCGSNPAMITNITLTAKDATETMPNDYSFNVSVSHYLTAVEAKPATCTESGHCAYWQCSVCKDYFLDADATTETTLDTIVIPALGHNLSSTDNADGTHTARCSRCDYSIVEKHTFVDGYCSECGSQKMEAVVSMTDGSARTGKKFTLPVFLDSENTVCAAQFDLALPSGVSMAYTINRLGVMTYTASLGTERFESLDHSIAVSNLGNGCYRFIISSNTNASFLDTDASDNEIQETCPIVNITLQVADDLDEGNYEIKIDNITLSHYDAEAQKIQKYTANSSTATLTIKNYYSVSVLIVDDSMGTVSVAGDKFNTETGETDYNSQVIITATPKPGYHFVKWMENEDSISIDNPLTLTITRNRTITAEFAIDQYNVKFVADSVTVYEKNQDYGSAIVTPEAPSKQGYVFISWGEVDATVPLHDVTYTAEYALLGDVYEDEVIDVADVSSVINIILNDIELSDREMKIANVYAEDDVIDVADASSVVNIIMNPSEAKQMLAKDATDHVAVSLSAVIPEYIENGNTKIGIALDDVSSAAVALQFDINLTDGIRLDDKHTVTKAVDVAHSLAYKKIDDHHLRVMLYSMTNDAIFTDEANLLSIGISIDNISCADQMKITGIKVFTTWGDAFSLDDKSYILSGTNVTGITSYENDNENKCAYYNLAGQRVSKVFKGVYVVNGKKTINK